MSGLPIRGGNPYARRPSNAAIAITLGGVRVELGHPARPESGQRAIDLDYPPRRRYRPPIARSVPPILDLRPLDFFSGGGGIFRIGGRIRRAFVTNAGQITVQ